MPGKHRRSEQRCQDLGWKAHDVRKKNILFRAHTPCMSYVTNNFISVSSSVRSKQLLCQFVHSQGQKSEQKPTTKNFVGFHSHSPLLTMFTKALFIDTNIIASIFTQASSSWWLARSCLFNSLYN